MSGFEAIFFPSFRGHESESLIFCRRMGSPVFKRESPYLRTSVGSVPTLLMLVILRLAKIAIGFIF